MWGNWKAARYGTVGWQAGLERPRGARSAHLPVLSVQVFRYKCSLDNRVCFAVFKIWERFDESTIIANYVHVNAYSNFNCCVRACLGK